MVAPLISGIRRRNIAPIVVTYLQLSIIHEFVAREALTKKDCLYGYSSVKRQLCCDFTLLHRVLYIAPFEIGVNWIQAVYPYNIICCVRKVFAGNAV